MNWLKQEFAPHDSQAASTSAQRKMLHVIYNSNLEKFLQINLKILYPEILEILKCNWKKMFVKNNVYFFWLTPFSKNNDDVIHRNLSQEPKKTISFPNFSCRFLNHNIFSNFNSNCSNLSEKPPGIRISKVFLDH